MRRKDNLSSIKLLVIYDWFVYPIFVIYRSGGCEFYSKIKPTVSGATDWNFHQTYSIFSYPININRNIGSSIHI